LLIALALLDDPEPEDDEDVIFVETPPTTSFDFVTTDSVLEFPT
jgi:hypothetical protein